MKVWNSHLLLECILFYWAFVWITMEKGYSSLIMSKQITNTLKSEHILFSAFLHKINQNCTPFEYHSIHTNYFGCFVYCCYYLIGFRATMGRNDKTKVIKKKPSNPRIELHKDVLFPSSISQFVFVA